MHTLLDLRGNIPTFIRVTSRKVHDVNILDEILPEAGAFYVMDRGYVDFERLYIFTLSAAFFVVRTKSNVLLQRRYSHPVDKTTGVRAEDLDHLNISRNGVGHDLIEKLVAQYNDVFKIIREYPLCTIPVVPDLGLAQEIEPGPSDHSSPQPG